MAKKIATKTFHQTKKQLKKELAGKIESALPEIKVTLGEKKFSKRVKKAAKLFTEGMHLNSNTKKISKKSFSTNGLNTNGAIANTSTATV